MRVALSNIVACLLGVHPLTVDWATGEWRCVVPWCTYRESAFKE